MPGGFSTFLAHSNIINFVKDAGFPCSKQDLINEAEDHNAPQDVIEALEKLPDQVYNTLTDVRDKLPK